MSKETDRDKIEYKYRTSVGQSVDGVCMVEVSIKSDDPFTQPANLAEFFDVTVEHLKKKGYPVAGTTEAAELRKKK